MRRGIARDGEHLYPAFPYDHFTHADAISEIDALYAWLMTRRPIAGRAPADAARPASRLPAAGRGLEPALSARGPARRPIRRRSAEWNRGRALAEGLAHCGGCHTPRNRLGAEDSDARLRRRLDRGLVRAAAQRALAGGAAVDAEELLRLPAHRPRRRTHAAAAGPMGGVTRALAQVPDEDVRAIAVYFASLMAHAPAAQQDQPSRSIELAVAQQRASRGGGALRRRLRDLPRARRADDAAGPAAARLGHAAARGQSARRGAHHHAGPDAAGRRVRARRCRPSPTCSSDRQVHELAAYLRTRFTDKPPWSDVPARRRAGARGRRE